MRDSNRSTHPFRVIEGGAQAPPSWLDLPSRVIARSPLDRECPVDFRFSKERLIGLDKVRRRQPTFDAWALVHAKLPPIPNRSKLASQLGGHALVGLRHAHACFRGTMRPVGNDNRGWDVVAYVSRPSIYVRYEPDLVCVGRIAQAPDDVVFVTYVRLDREGGKSRAGSSTVSGVVTHWQFVEAAGGGTLPIGFQERYRRQLW